MDVFLKFLKREDIKQINLVNQNDVRLFLSELYQKQISRRSVSRMISCLRSFFRFLEREDIVDVNPFAQIVLPKSTNQIPNFLYKEELKKLFKVSDLNQPLGQRDQAMIETLY